MSPTVQHRELSEIACWLLSAAEEPDQAHHDWDGGIPALLPLGGAFDAVKVPAGLVHATVDSRSLSDAAAALSQLGPVICEPHRWYYALVPVGTAAAWIDRQGVGLGSGTWCAVPRPDCTVPVDDRRRPYWAVPPDTPGRLCDPEALAALLQAGGERLEVVERRETAHRVLLDHMQTCTTCSMERNVAAIADDCDAALAPHQSTASHASLTDRANLMRRHLAVLIPIAEAQRGEYEGRDRALVPGALRDAEQLLAVAPQEDRIRAWVQLRALARVARILAQAHRPRYNQPMSVCETGAALRLTVRMAR
ncbi:DUF6415 family natural product biosynthesis protein [Streptomyces sp. NPDC091212]|uniref:DUF6415 family natural product biosynthesis protein n=1 Tax=Streptomyces sp. NPDC091212 TaxID=3155191 RepID=UPI00341A045D